ncbi:MAG: MarR family transcriptional regulator [Opitutales bacterium]|nr:MarR family transcriptional regulator [Opitutales bacterium]
MHHLHATRDNKLSRIGLAEKVGLTASGVTRVLLPMEKNHLVSRESNPRDARQSLVVMTDAGRELFQNAQVTAEYSTEEILSLLDQDELSLLVKLLNKLKC